MHRFDRDSLKVQLEPLSNDSLTTFALLSAERLYAVFWAFSKREFREKELGAFNDTLAWAWMRLSNSEILSEFQTVSQRTKGLVHDSEQFGDPLAVQAQCAAIALTYAVQSFTARNLDLPSWSALQVVEAINNFVWFSADITGYQLPQDFKNALLARELRKQSDDIATLTSRGKHSDSGIDCLRTHNRLFSVPIAV